MSLGILSVFTHFFHFVLGISTPQGFPPPLSAAEEAACFKKKDEGDEAARQRLIEHNLRLVSHIVRKYYASAPNPDELVSVGVIGLVKAVDSFCPAHGARFATYAAKCIRNEILMFFRAQKRRNTEVSLNETIDVDRDGNPLTYMDVICSEESMTQEIERKICGARARSYVQTLLEERERQIIVLRYGLGGEAPLAQREVAERLGISRSYVSRIEKAALERLRSAFGS